MSHDPDRQDERQISTDRETIRGWADRHQAVPVRRGSARDETERPQLVPETGLEDTHERVEWDSFHEELESGEYVVLYRGETADEPFEVTGRDEMLSRSDVDSDRLEERLLEGETVTSEITETTVVESVVVEEATVESELVGSEAVDQRVIDVELLRRECTGCDLVDDREIDHGEWFDTDRYLGSLGGERGDRGLRGEGDETDTGGAGTPETRTRTGATDAATPETDVTGTETRGTDTTGTEIETPRTGATDTDVGGTDVERDFPFHAELDVEEAWMVTREYAERFTVESRITDTEVTEADTVEDHDIDVEGLQRSIAEQGILDIDRTADEVMAEYDVETEFAEDDRIRTHFERTRVVEDDVVDRMRARAEITSADLAQMDVANEMDLATEITGSAGVEDERTATGGTTEGSSRVEFTDDDVGNTVVETTGDEIGMVTEVEPDANMIYVDAAPSLTERVKAALDWGDPEKDDHPVRASEVERVDGDEIRLKSHERLDERDETDLGEREEPDERTTSDRTD